MEISTSQQSSAESESSIEVQRLRTQTEIAQLAFQEKELATNFEFARLEIDHSREMEKQFQNHKRKTFTMTIIFLFSILTVILTFLAWCLSIGKEQFVIDLLKYSLYPISAGGGYWAGRISRSSISNQ